MPLYFYLYSSIVLLIAILIIRSVVLHKKNIPIRLFSIGVKNENSGHYEEALINYTNALAEAKKFRFHNDFRNKVRARLKVLQTIIAYQKNSCQPVSCETNQL